MESPTRTPSDPLNTVTAMHEQPWEFDFFQALRRIECGLADDPLRMGQQPDSAFAPSTLASMTPTSENSPARLEQFFFGLGGPNGPLPLHITEYVRERQRNNADSTSKRFLDVFHHRLLSLFYRAWAEARPTGHGSPHSADAACRACLNRA